MDELIDEANEDLKVMETAILAGIVAGLDEEFNRLLEEISAQLQSGQLLLEGSDMRALELIGPLDQADSDEFLDLFERLLQRNNSRFSPSWSVIEACSTFSTRCIHTSRVTCVRSTKSPRIPRATWKIIYRYCYRFDWWRLFGWCGSQ